LNVLARRENNGKKGWVLNQGWGAGPRNIRTIYKYTNGVTEMKMSKKDLNSLTVLYRVIFGQKKKVVFY
jgi:hypothetical protein